MTDSPRQTRNDAAIRAALEQHRQRTYQEEEARKPPPLSEQAGSRMQLREPPYCPFPHELLTRSFGFTGIPMSDDEATRCRKAHGQTQGSSVERATVLCSPSPVVIPGGARAAYPAQLWHAELIIDGRRVHIESIVQQLAGPGGTNEEVRVYVDGVLNGRSHKLGRLGASVMWSPVAASVRPGLTLIVTPVRFTRFDELIVELRE